MEDLPATHLSLRGPTRQIVSLTFTSGALLVRFLLHYISPKVGRLPVRPIGAHISLAIFTKKGNIWFGLANETSIFTLFQTDYSSLHFSSLCEMEQDPVCHVTRQLWHIHHLALLQWTSPSTTTVSMATSTKPSLSERWMKEPRSSFRPHMNALCKPLTLVGI